MIRKSLLIALAAAALVMFGAYAAAGAQETGSVKGSVVNATAGGAALGDGAVTLKMYRGPTEVESKTAAIDAEGRFTFEGLEAAADVVYQASFEHQGVTYYSVPLAFNVDTMEHNTEIRVYDTTDDSAVVKSVARHFLLLPAEMGVRVVDITILRNETDRTYVGTEQVHPGKMQTLRFSVPPEAVDLEWGDGFVPDHIFPVDGGFADAWPLYPGDAQRVFSYTIPSVNGSAPFTARIDLATEKVNVLMPDTGADLSVSNLPDRSNQDIQGTRYLQLAGANLAAGTELAFQINRLPTAAGAPAPAGTGAGEMIAYVAGSGVMVIMAAALGIVTIRRRRQASRKADVAIEDGEADEDEDEDVPAAPAEVDELEMERQDLIAAIASLDDAYEQGRIGSEEYGMLRANQKARLLEIVARQNEMAPSRGES